MFRIYDIELKDLQSQYGDDIGWIIYRICLEYHSPIKSFRFSTLGSIGYRKAIKLVEKGMLKTKGNLTENEEVWFYPSKEIRDICENFLILHNI